MQKKIKPNFLHIANLDTVGGVEQLLYHLIQSDTTCSNHIYSPGGKIHAQFNDLKTKAASLSYEKYLWGMKLPRFLRSIKKAYALRKKYNAVILWNRLENIDTPNPLIYYEHGASWIIPQNHSVEPLLQRVDKIIAASHAAKRMLELKWNLQKPITVIENPLRPDIEFGIAREKPHTPLVLGCIGRLLPLKGFVVAIEAVRRLVKQKIPVTLLIAGTGPDEMTLRKAAVGLPVQFLGTISIPTSFYDAIDILLVPSIREPFGLVALEAAARGVPVIASQVDGLPHVCALDALQQTQPIEMLQSYGGSLKNMPDLVYDPLLDVLREPRIIDPDALVTAILRTVSTYAAKSAAILASVQSRPPFAAYAASLKNCSLIS